MTHPVMHTNCLPVPIPYHPNFWNNDEYNQPNSSTQTQFQQQGLLNGPVLQMNPPVMPEVTGYFPGCSKTFDQIAVKTLTHSDYVAWSEYPEQKPSEKKMCNHGHSWTDLVQPYSVSKMLDCRQITLARCPASALMNRSTSVT